MTRGKRQHMIRNLEIAATAVVIIIVAIGSAFYFDKNAAKPVTPTSLTPLAVGDIFTFKLSGTTVLGSSDVVTPAEFMDYNNTEYYNVTVTAINGEQVSLETDWQFKNSTIVAGPQVINLSNGATAELAEFSYLYPSNLTVNDRLYPQESGNLRVNSTDTESFAHINRAVDFWQTEDQFANTNDQTFGTMRYDYVGVHFDRQSGMMVSLTRIEFFTNPEIQLTITWQLVSSNAWTVN